MRRPLLSCLALFYCILQSCNKDSDPNSAGRPDPSTQGPIVYLAGSYTDLTRGTGGNQAAYWKNDSLNVLPGGTSSTANAIFVSKGDVFVTGEVDAQPAYWKNGVMTSLSHGLYYDAGTAIAVNGTDVYIAGTGFNTLGHFVAGYWKNGVYNQLSSDKNNAYCSGIAISGNDVYFAGYESNPASGKPILQGKCWKNGVPIDLTGGESSTSLNDIFISDKDIYVCGYLTESSGTNGQRSTAKCWKNGQSMTLPAGTAEISIATSVWVSGSDVYVSGYKKATANDKAVAVYWKNGIVTTLSDGSTDGYTGNLVVSDTDVFASYYATPASGRAAYIKNGKVIEVTDGVKASGQSSFIFIDNRK